MTKCKDGRVFVSSHSKESRPTGALNMRDKVKVTKEGLWNNMTGQISVIKDGRVTVDFKSVQMTFNVNEVEKI